MTTPISVAVTPDPALGIWSQLVVCVSAGLFGIAGQVDVGGWGSGGGVLLGWVVGDVERGVVVGGEGGAFLEADVREGFQGSLEELV